MRTMDSRGDEAFAALHDAITANEGTCEERTETAAAILDSRLATTEAGNSASGLDDSSVRTHKR